MDLNVSNYNSMSIAQIVSTRQEVLKEINEQVASLNKQFVQNPMQLNTETINHLFENLKEINETIQTKKDEVISKKEKKSCLTSFLPAVTKVTWITIGFEFTAGVLIAIQEILNLILTHQVESKIEEIEESCDKKVESNELQSLRALSISGLVSVIISTGILLPLVAAIREIDNDKDRLELLLKVCELKEQGEEIQDFLKSFQNFKKEVHESKNIGSASIEQQAYFSDCIQSFDNLPESSFRRKIPSRDHWISLMIQLLPDDHSIKLQLIEMRDNALKQLYITPDKDPNQKKLIGLTLRSTVSSSSSSSNSEDDLKIEKFEGEKQAIINTERIERRSSFGLDQAVQVPNSVFRKQFEKEWESLEQTLKIKFDKVQLDDIGMRKDAFLASNISYLGAVFIEDPTENF